jgi:putative hydrolase of the HAD superfamily
LAAAGSDSADEEEDVAETAHWPDVRAVFFDAVGTVIHPEPSAAAIYTAVGQRHGSRLSTEEIRQRFAAAFRQQELLDRSAGWAVGPARELERWRTIVAEVLADASDLDACFVELYEHFSLPSAWRLDPDLSATLTGLTGRGHTVGLASNYDERLRRLAAELPVLASLSPLLISSEVGWRKPAPGFFAALCQAVALPPAEILIVGDDPDNDYDGARRAGMQAILFDPQGKHAALDVPRLERLRDLHERWPSFERATAP